MKRIILLGLFMLALSVTYAQENPVNWKFWGKKLKGNNYELHFEASIDPPYHIYSQKNISDVALPTTIDISHNPMVTLVDSVREVGKLERKKDKSSGQTINYYADQIDFVQVIKLKSKVKTRIKGSINYMACTSDHCLPEAKQVFTISVGP